MPITKKEFKPLVVVVDDSEFTRKKIISDLDKNGITVVGEAGTAEKAMEVAATTEANIFIIDIVMPQISGLELTKALTDKFRSKISVIAISSLTTESVVIDAISNGALDFLSKPVDINDLISSIAKIIKIRTE